MKAFEGRRVRFGRFPEPGPAVLWTACMLLAEIGLLAAVAGVAAALADQDAPDACKTDVVGSEDRGLERIAVTSPCRHGEPVRAIFDGSVQQETFFSDDGVANLAIALTVACGPITLSYQDGSRETVAFDHADAGGVRSDPGRQNILLQTAPLS